MDMENSWFVEPLVRPQGLVISTVTSMSVGSKCIPGSPWMVSSCRSFASISPPSGFTRTISFNVPNRPTNHKPACELQKGQWVAHCQTVKSRVPSATPPKNKSERDCPRVVNKAPSPKQKDPLTPGHRAFSITTTLIEMA